LPPELAEERRHDQRKTLAKVADLAIERGVDFVLVAGDLFDSPDPDPSDLEAVTASFARLLEAGKRIFAIPGNHDPISPRNFWSDLERQGVHVFTKTEWDTVVLEDMGICVVGAAFDKARSDRRAFEGLCLEHEMPAIVLVHASTEMFAGQVENYHPFSQSELAQTRAAYVALGHYHSFKLLDAGETIACYPGTPEGISFDPAETGDRFVVLGKVDDDGRVEVEPFKVNTRVMQSIELDCTSFESEASLLDAVRQFCGSNVLIELRLVGNPRPELSLAIESLPDRFKEACLHLRVNTEGLSLLRELPTEDRTIKGRFCRYMLEQIQGTEDVERRRLLQRALELGLAAFKES
jgi:DNA repair exonuclease SbcCD nuclease subunit